MLYTDDLVIEKAEELEKRMSQLHDDFDGCIDELNEEFVKEHDDFRVKSYTVYSYLFGQAVACLSEMKRAIKVYDERLRRLEEIGEEE